MTTTISFGLQKGGVGKSTTTSITAYLLSQNKKVLAVDLDSQGNLTRLLTQKNIYDFEGRTILEAFQEKTATKFVYQVTDNLHILPAEDALAILPNRLTVMYKTRKEQLSALSNLLKEFENVYDYILIDMPPNLGDQTLNAMVASDYTVVVLQTEPFAFEALERYLKTLERVREEFNSRLTLAGILTCLMQTQTSIDCAIREQALEDYEDMIFTSVIKRKARIKEFVWEGITNKTKVDKVALENYQSFLGELLERVEKG
jgi:chromosome partitioning protein